ncbi:hypothetical protein KUTeg_013373 [Tegillarca granosa]|uniref:VWF/SSPO/Zonadhesin-like cysteine-rich domain-containing protein n=1 Tax=Tegillarca granosa TaxID=220873 RepID=A0ABQ9ETH7_TEGGR|nr:hypothetical protein KUTeg_013373 [Tegillarca granosa]
MTGLCGDCNGRRDDFRTKEGKDVTNAKNRYTLIGNSFAVEDDSDITRKRCKSENDTFTCEEKVKKLARTPSFCAQLQNQRGPFGECIKKNPDLAKEYFTSCVFDICAYIDKREFITEAKCDAMEAFAEECADNGINVNWRKPDFCPLECDINMEYRNDGTGCPATCSDFNAPETCDLEPREGCYCKAGFVLSDGKCIPQSECGCRDKNGDYFPMQIVKNVTRLQSAEKMVNVNVNVDIMETE